MNISRALVIGSILLGAATTAHAAVLYDNLGSSTGTTYGVSADSGGWLAASFQSGPSFALTEVRLLMQASDPGDGGSFLVTLMPDVGGAPDLGSEVDFAVVLDSDLSTSLQVISAAGSPIGMDPFTRYWIGLLEIDPSSAEWAQDDGSGVGTGFGVAGEFTYITGNGDGSDPLTAVDVNDDGAFQMCVGGAFIANEASGPGRSCYSSQPTPEPATLGILGVALAGLGLLRLRRRTR